MIAVRHAALAAGILASVMALAAAPEPPTVVPAFEVLGASQDWVVLRENVLVGPSDQDVCRYAGLDPSIYSGARVHFVPLSGAARLGKLVEPDLRADEMAYLSPGSSAQGCTTATEARDRWSAIAAHASERGIPLTERLQAPLILGTAIPADACDLSARQRGRSKACDVAFAPKVNGQPFQISLSIRAVREVPNLARCQYVGYRLGVALQVAGLDFGALGSPAPGGFATHYDCRTHQLEPLRLYALEDQAVLLGSFRAVNIADRTSYPFLVVFATKRQP